jgi:serine/threonine protein kinase
MNASRTVDGCPDQGELAAFQLGTLPPETLETIAEHLRGCQTCETKMQALAEPVDELVTTLRQLAGSELGQEDLSLDPEAFALEQASWSESAEEPVEQKIEQVREYRVLEKLGQGGMGTVFRAVHSRLGRTVALKILRERQHRSPGLVARFHREMKAVGMLDHPNIVRATDAGEWQGTDYLVMELIEGMDVGTLLRHLGQAPMAEACEIARQAALGLAHAHEHGMVHRDVKPSNLLLSRQGVVKLTDLGLVRGGAAEEVGPSTTSHYVLGSLEYMAPEQAEDPHGADSRADLYALGCTLYELLAGQPPFAGAAQCTVLQKLKAHASAPIPSLCERRRDIPKPLASVVEKLLAKNPSERMASASELVDALAPFTAGADLRKLLEQAEHAPTSAAQSPARQLTGGGVPNSTRTQVPKRRHFRWVGALMGAAVAVFAGVVLYLQTDQGVIQIDTKDDDVKISVERGGKVIEIMDLQKKKTYRLASGGYELKIVAGKEDFEIKPQSLTLKRGETEIVRISRLDKQPFAKVQWPELDKAWLEKAARLSPEEKADEIIKELVRRNPGFEGKGVKVQAEEGKLSMIFTQGLAGGKNHRTGGRL